MAVDQQTSRDSISVLTVPHQQPVLLLYRNLQLRETDVMLSFYFGLILWSHMISTIFPRQINPQGGVVTVTG